MVRRPVALPFNSASALVNELSANRRKIRPSTGAEYSDGRSVELAHSWSAAAHSRRSSSARSFPFLALLMEFVSVYKTAGAFMGL